MSVGKRMKFFRKRKGMTQQELGGLLGFSEKTSDVRIAQYESGARVPKSGLVEKMAHIFDVSPRAITVPEIDSYAGLTHTLFALEDMYGLKAGKIDGEICLCLKPAYPDVFPGLYGVFCAWQEQSARLERGEITREEYDQWRYHFQ